MKKGWGYIIVSEVNIVAMSNLLVQMGSVSEVFNHLKLMSHTSRSTGRKFLNLLGQGESNSKQFYGL